VQKLQSLRTTGGVQDVRVLSEPDVAAVGYRETHKIIAVHCKGVVKRYPLRTAGGM
jgi:prophage antirepressor-like protein